VPGSQRRIALSRRIFVLLIGLNVAFHGSLVKRVQCRAPTSSHGPDQLSSRQRGVVAAAPR
jgi:hypothetical protein